MNREITLRDYGRVLWSGRWVILATVAIGVLVALALTFARSTQYTAKATVSMGQATTVSGVPVQTPYTNPTTAPQVLDSDEVVEAVADRAGVSASRVREATTLSAPRVSGATGNLPTILTVTSTDGSREKAITIANAYAEQVLLVAGRGFAATQQVYRQQFEDSQQAVDQLTRETRLLRAQLVTASGERAAIIQSALLSAQDQLRTARQSASDQEVLLTKSRDIEGPKLVGTADSASSSSTAPRRLQSVLLGALIGLFIGVLAVFVWKGSPAGRAADG